MSGKDGIFFFLIIRADQKKARKRLFVTRDASDDVTGIASDDATGISLIMLILWCNF